MWAAVMLGAVAAASGQSQAPAPAKAVLSNFFWMTGSWIDDSGGNVSEEVWSAPSGDSMMGMWRYIQGGKTQIYELLTLHVEGSGIVLRLRHFDPQLAAREDKEKSLELKLVAWKDREARFEGTEVSGTGLVALTYRNPSEDRLSVTLEKGGKTQEFAFRRAPQGFVH
jgi:hypothetical protein